jgi:hypothetical protein
LAQREGFLEIAATADGYTVHSLGPDGAELGSVPKVTSDIALALAVIDPRGGFVVATTDAIQSFDGRVKPRWSVSIADITEHRYSIGVDVSGAVLFLFDAGARFPDARVAGLAISASGKRSPIFRALPSKFGDTWLRTAPALEGGLFVQENSPLGEDWVRYVDPISLSTNPPPLWLGRLGSWAPNFAHGRSAYALTPSERGAFSPTCTVQVATPAGTSCGSIEFDNPSGSCDSASEINIGPEGTLVQSLGAPRSCSGSCMCTWRVWPGYLR